jgi:hypothetical protein
MGRLPSKTRKQARRDLLEFIIHGDTSIADAPACSAVAKQVWPRIRWQTLAELAAIAAWACWIGRAYLDFNRYTWPAGGEFGTQAQTHHLWTQALRCGACALWNGGINGGAPALADLFGSMLHPLVMLTTLLWGVVAGAKVAVIVSLALGGVAQWWIAKVLRVDWLPRLWSALLAVVGGHLAGRMENGNVGLVLSTAACSLALAAAFDLGVTRERRATLLLAITGALAIVSGQAYLQLALLCWTPALVCFLLDFGRPAARLGREYALAGGLALSLAGIFLVPLLHFWPNVAKDIDPTFGAAQPFWYIPLNLVRGDMAYMRSTAFGKLPYPYMYNLYIGACPTILAVIALPLARRADRRALLFLASGAVLMFLVASATPLLWLRGVAPLVANVRHTPLIAGLAVPAILGLAAYGLDRVLIACRSPLILGRWMGRLPWWMRPGVRWLPVAALAWSLAPPAILTRTWLKVVDARPLYAAVAALRTPNLEWVAPPYGELKWTEAALHLGFKLSPIVWVFQWQAVAMPYLEALRDGQPAASERLGPLSYVPSDYAKALRKSSDGPSVSPIGKLDSAPIYRNANSHYAAVRVDVRSFPCQASGSGGDLSIVCTNTEAGDLIVQEHAWSGWSAFLDGKPVALIPGQWLRVPAPAGRHQYTLRYRPWDVPAGLALTLVGVALTLWLWIRSRTP